MLQDLSILSVLLRIVLAVFCGGIIGAERLMRGRAAGIRTHVILCVGATITVLAGLYAVDYLGYNADPLRIGAQVMSGVGFLGVGTILIKGRMEVTGLTTAAGLWTTAAIGLVIGIGYYFLALLVTGVLVIAILVVKGVENNIRTRRSEFEMYLEIDDVSSANSVIDKLSEQFDVFEVDITAPRSAVNGNVGIQLMVSAKEGVNPDEVKQKVREYEHVLIVLESV